jgi:Asp/Glu/hydantoin racemase
MVQTLAIIHTSPTLTPMFSALCAAEMPDVSIFHMVDESLIRQTIRAGVLQGITIRRLLGQIESAELAGADAVMVTCSSIGPGVALGQKLFDLPVIRVDEAVAATLRTTLEPTVALLREKSAEAGREIEIVESLSHGAFDAVLAGDTETHDRILSESLLRDMRDVDLIVLAQASMARVVKALPPGMLRAPVLSSPESAVRRAREVLSSMRSAQAAGAHT